MTSVSKRRVVRPPRGEDPAVEAGDMSEAAWIDVIRKMDETYADLVRHQVQVEEKNAALEEAQQFIRSVLASINDVLVVCDRQGRIQQVNRALERLAGRREAELRGLSIDQLFECEDAALGDKLWALGRDEPVEDCEVRLRGRTDVVLSVNCTPRLDSRRRHVGMVIIARPLGELRRAYHALNQAHSELIQAQQQLVQSETMASLGRLVAGVAHELNNPISFVYGNIHALKRYVDRLARYAQAVHTGKSDEQLRQLRQELKIDRALDDLDSLMSGTLEGAERVRDIVQDLRLFSSGKQAGHTKFDLVRVVRTAVHWVTKQAEPDLNVVYRLPEQVVVNGHPGQIHQVIMNLVQNALDAMQEAAQRRLKIALYRAEGYIRLTVRDTGPGFAHTQLERAFEPFFTTKPVGQGTGLGLAISYRIAREHGGTLRAENHPEGGALLTLELPC